MKVQGTKTTHEDVILDVSMADVLEAIKKELKKKFKVDDSWYINRTGFWEDWYDTGHGSGLTTKHRKALDEEINCFEAIAQLKQTLKGA